MADDPHAPAGWLPPQAPGAQQPPRFAPPAFEPPVASAPAPHPADPAPASGPRGKLDPLAVASVLLGVAGLLLLLTSLGFLFLFTLPLSLGAWLAAVQSRRRFAAGRAERGRRLANAGRILGIAGGLIGVIATITWIVLFANGYTPESLQQDLERELERREQQQERRESDAPEAAVRRGAVSAGAARAAVAPSGGSPRRRTP